MQSKLKFKCSPCNVKFDKIRTGGAWSDKNIAAADLSKLGGITASKVTVNGSVDVAPETDVSKVEENLKVFKKIKILI